MKSTKGFLISMWLGILVGAGLLIWTIFMAVDYSSKKNNGVNVQAAIEQVDYIRYKNGHPSVYGTAVYADSSGQLHRFNGYLGDFVDVGDKVSLIYEKDNPGSVIRENEALPWLPWVGGGMVLFCGAGLILFTFFRFDKKAVRCMQQTVSPDELSRIISEYMPQTRKKFITERSKNKHFDKLGCDTVLQRMIDSGDPVKQVYDHYQETLLSDDIRLGAVVNVTDRDIYSEMKDINSEDIENGYSRFTVPVFMIYGEDEYFNYHPNELLEIASRFSGAGFDFALDQQDSQFVEYILNRSSRPMGVRYQGHITNGRTVILTTVILSKSNLCNKKLCNKLLYLSVNGKYAAAVPAWYYSLWELSAF